MTTGSGPAASWDSGQLLSHCAHVNANMSLVTSARQPISSTEINCGYPGNIENGYVDGRSFLYGDSVRYSCKQGFRITGAPEERICGDHRRWQGTEPQCTRE